MPNILVEGCDGAGKTSLIDALIKLDPRYRVIHLGPPGDYDDGKRMYVEMLDRLWHEDRLIYDRAHLSELVYAPMLRDYEPYYITWVESLLPHDTLLVMCSADLPTIQARFDGKFITPMQLPEILRRYEWAFEHSHMRRKTRIDTAANSPYQCAALAWHMAENTYLGEGDDR